jgi:hypothetical protein
MGLHNKFSSNWIGMLWAHSPPLATGPSGLPGKFVRLLPDHSEHVLEVHRRPMNILHGLETSFGLDSHQSSSAAGSTITGRP